MPLSRMMTWTVLFGCALGLLGCGAGGGEDARTSQDGQAAEDGKPERKPNAVYERQSRHPRVELSNLDFGTSVFGRDMVSVDWRLQEGSIRTSGNLLMVIKLAKGSQHRVSVSAGGWDEGGTFAAEFVTFGFGSSETRLQDGCEVFLAVKEGSDHDDPLFKVSNSLTAGSVSRTTVAEAAPPELRKAPPQRPATPPADSKPSVASNTRQESPPRPARPKASAQARPQAPPRPPPGAKAPEDPDLAAVPEDLSIPAGTPLRAEWARKWSPVTALEDSAAGGIKIHWEGYSSGFDRTVPRSDLRIETTVLNRLRTGQPPQRAGAPQPVTAKTALKPGMKIEAEWAGRYLPVTILQLAPDGRVKIHWDNYSRGFDQFVPRSRLRLPAGAAVE